MENKDITGLTDQELNEKVQESKAALNKLTLNHTISPVEHPHKIRIERRAVAKMLTEVSKRKNASNK
jgi:large subunit ribosomal protein L29